MKYTIGRMNEAMFGKHHFIYYNYTDCYVWNGPTNPPNSYKKNETLPALNTGLPIVYLGFLRTVQN